MAPVVEFAAFASNMPFGKPSHPDAEVALVANKSYQLTGILKTPGRGFEFTSPGRIPAQRQYVFNAKTFNLLQQILDLLASRAYAGQVRHCSKPMFLLDAINDSQRLIARATTGAVSHGAVIRAGLHQR